MPDDSPTRSPEREYRDTDPVAIWGLVLTFVFWPLGLVLSFLALRRIRRTRDGGWGLAMVGAILSTIAAVVSIVGLLWFLSTSGVVGRWQDAATEQRNEGRVHSVIGDVSRELEAQHEESGEWASSIRDLQDVDVDDDGEVNEVEVLAFRSGDTICVQGARGDYAASEVGGEVAPMGCVDRGYASTLSASTAQATKDGDKADLDTALVEVRRRGEDRAAGSSIGTPPDVGYYGGREVDLEICAVLAGNREDLTDRADREALTILLEEPVSALGEVDFENALSTMTTDLDLEETLVGGFWEGYLNAEFTCWNGGFVDGDGVPDFPEVWTTLVSDDDRAEQHRVSLAWDQMTDAERAPYNDQYRARDELERTQIEAILAAGYGSGA